YAVETEAAAALSAFHSRKPSAFSIVIRGISDLSAGKMESDAVGEGAWRRCAARNAAKLLVVLLSNIRIEEAERLLDRPAQGSSSDRDGDLGPGMPDRRAAATHLATLNREAQKILKRGRRKKKG